MQTLFALSILLLATSASVSGSLLSRLRNDLSALYHLHDVVHQELLKIGHHPNETLLGRFFPEATKMISQRALRLKHCYDESFGAVKVNIFKAPLRTVIIKFLKINLSLASIKPQEIATKIRNLITNLIQLVKYILTCVSNDNPNFQPTTLGLTKFAAMSPSQLAVYKTPLPPLGRSRGDQLSSRDSFTFDNDKLKADLSMKLPVKYDYRDQGVVSPVKDQGNCGTCFLFGAMASMESAYMLKHNKTGVIFSEQDLLNCLWQFGAYKRADCRSGGETAKVFLAAKARGLMAQTKENEFNLTHKDGTPYSYQPKRCQTVPIAGKLAKYGHLADVPANPKTLESILLKYGPIAMHFRIAWEGDSPTGSGAFMNLRGRQNIPCNSSAEHAHVMTVVGWDEKYYIIKNSYGNYEDVPGAPLNKQPWGIGGYLYMRKDLAEGCGVFGKGSTWFFPQME